MKPFLLIVTLLTGCQTERQVSHERHLRFQAMMNDEAQMDAISDRVVELRKVMR